MIRSNNTPLPHEDLEKAKRRIRMIAMLAKLSLEAPYSQTEVKAIKKLIKER